MADGLRMEISGCLEAIRGKRVLVIGDIMLDHYIWGDAGRLSPEAPVPVVQVARESWTAGGAANVAANVCALGAKAMLFGALGEDESAQRLIRLMEQWGVRMASGCMKPARATIVKSRVVCRRQQLCRLDREQAPSVFAVGSKDLERHVEPLLPRMDAVILSDYAKGVITTELIAWLMAQSSRP